MSLKKCYRTKPALLSHVKNLLEGYDHLAVMSTTDAKSGIFELSFPVKMEKEVLLVMKGIMGEVEVEEY